MISSMNNKLLRKIQLTQFEIYQVINTIAKQNNITLYLCAGTMLGAVRNKGFIPWDDDLDIMVVRQEYDRLMELLEHELPENYWIQNYKTDKEYWQPFAKVRKLGTIYKEKCQVDMADEKCGVWVDIFPLDYAEKRGGILLRLRRSIVKTIGFSLRKRVFHHRISEFSRRYIPILLFWQLFTANSLKKIQVYFMKNVSDRDAEYIVNLASTYDISKETYPADWFDGNCSILFENYDCTVPVGYKEYLSQLYGDYMTPPPPEKRCGHNVEDFSKIIV